MPCLAQDYHRLKLPAATNHYCKSLSSLVRETYAHCHVPCVRSPAAGWSSGDDSDDDDASLDDTKQVIVNEMRNRQMKKRSRCSVDYSPTPSSAFLWSPRTPLDARSVLEKVSTPKKCAVEEQEDEVAADGGGDDGGDGDDESEAFFSVKSFFSRSTSRGATVASSVLDTPPPLRSPATWEGFRDCEGWPFGLCRRPAVLPLPPLPSTPADSWQWRKRSTSNLSVASPAAAYSCKAASASS